MLFTATSFRRDRREIKGKYVYNYPMQRAFDDKIYGDMEFISVEPTEGSSGDIALARKVAEVFNEDAEAGLQHALMIRADSRTRADELQKVYGEVTDLRLEVLHSGKSARVTDGILLRLRGGDLDGVICVNMLGEGFDFPKLKVAALHSPHRSLGVTLQFLGRFARVNGDALGTAKFLAIPSEIGDKMGHLFKESQAWGKHIRLIGGRRISEEVATGEFLDDFEPSSAGVGDASMEDLSLHSFTVFNHVK